MDIKRKCRRALFVCVAVVMAAGLYGCADFNAGKSAYKNGDYKTAIANWAPLAEKGFPKAQLNLGKMYLYGKGVEKDEKKAAKLIAAAADSDYSPAWLKMGELYQKGIGVEKDTATAERLMLKAYDAGNYKASYTLGSLYASKGLIDKAIANYEDAFIHGYPKAALNLGKMFEYGKGVRKNKVLALSYYDMAAKENVTEAQEKVKKVSASLDSDDVKRAEALAQRRFMSFKRRPDGKIFTLSEYLSSL